MIVHQILVSYTRVCSCCYMLLPLVLARHMIMWLLFRLLPICNPDVSLAILCWNVCGLNCPDRRVTVHETIAASSCHLVCLQESKLQVIDPFTAAYLGGQRLKNFAYKPADGTKGGILLLWDEAVVDISNVQLGSYFLSAFVAINNSSDSKSFKLTTVYGPTRSIHKDAFFLEPSSQKPLPGTKWLVNGDFNQIYPARDKNRTNVDRSRLVLFRNTLNSCELKEIDLIKGHSTSVYSIASTVHRVELVSSSSFATKSVRDKCCAEAPDQQF